MVTDCEIWQVIFRKREEIVCRDIAGETILVPIRGKLADMQQIFALNPVAEYIWRQMDGKRSVEDIRNCVMARFDVEQEQADSDIQEFIAELREAGLIEEAG